MKLMKSLKPIPLLILTITLVFFGLSIVEAPAAEKSAKITWGVRIPADSFNLWGMSPDYIYRGTDESVYIGVGVLKGKTTSTKIKFFVYLNDGSVWLSVPNVDIDENSLMYGDGETCGFPEPYNSQGIPSCIEEFLAAPQPFAGYKHIMLSFEVGADIEDETIFPEGVRIPCCACATFYVWNWHDYIVGIDPYYHTIAARVPQINLEAPAGFYITRLDANTWRFEVVQQNFLINENYEILEYGDPIGKSGKSGLSRNYFTPVEGYTNLSYVFELIKNPD